MSLGTLGVLAVAGRSVEEAVAATMAFTTFVLFQFFNALNARSESQTVFTRHLFTNRWLWTSFGAVAVLQIAAVQSGPLQEVFDTSPLSLAQWSTCVAVASSVLVVEEASKLVSKAKRRPQ